MICNVAEKYFVSYAGGQVEFVEFIDEFRITDWK
jgi:hypothetical protein